MRAGRLEPEFEIAQGPAAAAMADQPDQPGAKIPRAAQLWAFPGDTAPRAGWLAIVLPVRAVAKQTPAVDRPENYFTEQHKFISSKVKHSYLILL